MAFHLEGRLWRGRRFPGDRQRGGSGRQRAAFLLRLALPCLAFAGCGGGIASASPATLADPRAYLAQSRNCDGNPATPLRQHDPITCRRFDFGHYQASDSYLTPDGGAITTWDYPPFKGFAADPKDNGGEHYTVEPDGTVSIDSTQDGGKPGVVQHFADWWLYDTHVPDCSEGWRHGGRWGRACHTVVTYPRLGPVETIISEHGGSHVERFYMGLGWGRLAWEAWAPSCPQPLDPARAPAVSFDEPPAGHPTWRKCDERLSVNVEPTDGSLRGTREWRPSPQ